MHNPSASSPRIVVTGPSGWIGSAMLEHLAGRFGPGWDSAVTLFGSSARTQAGPGGVALQVHALDDLRAEHVDGAAVVHLAYLTKEKAASLGERSFTDTNLAIDDVVLKACADAQPRSLFVSSSGAAALAARGVDRHPYGLCKLRQEDRFLEWAAKSAVPMLAGRIFNIAGPYINKISSYAIGSFIEQARATGRISIEATIPVFRSFLHVDDLCGIVLASAINGIGRATATDFCGGEALEMEEIARAIALQIGGNSITVSRASIDWSRASVYLGDATHTKVLAMENGMSLLPFYQQVIDTISYMDRLRGGDRGGAAGGYVVD